VVLTVLTLPLLYHELRNEPSSYSYATESDRFRAHLALFNKLREIPGMLQPEITFDDGHLSNFEHALPILAEQSMAARFFITVGWTAARPGYMGWDQLRALHAAGQTIGAHGWTHTLLTHLTREALDRELRESRETLEDRLATPVTSMSLPGGRFNRQVMEACTAAGYTEIWTSIPRAEPFPFGVVLGRLNIRGNMTDAWLEKLLRKRRATRSGASAAHKRCGPDPARRPPVRKGVGYLEPADRKL
jgi:peptidoglycan/xylan/chitin deacetylase (PgdA/CDA1 family)